MLALPRRGPRRRRLGGRSGRCVRRGRGEPGGRRRCGGARRAVRLVAYDVPAPAPLAAARARRAAWRRCRTAPAWWGWRPLRRRKAPDWRGRRAPGRGRCRRGRPALGTAPGPAAPAAELREYLREPAARVHGAGGLRRAAGAAADRQRQGRPPGAAVARGGGRCRRRRRPRDGGAAPRTPVEELLAAIWAEVLGVRGARRRCTTTSSRSAATRCWPRRWCRGCAPRLGVELPLRDAVRGADGGRAWRAGSRRLRRAGSAPACAPPLVPAGRAARAGCRCPSPRSGSGSSTSWRRAARPTTCRPRCACAAPLARARPGAAASARSCAATRRCAPPSPALAGEPGAGDRRRRRALPLPLRRPRRAARRRRERAPARGARRRRARPFDLARGPLLRALLLRLGAGRARAAADRCTTSSATAGRWASWRASWRALRRVRRRAAVAAAGAAGPVRRLRRSGSAAGCGRGAGGPARLLAAAARRRAAAARAAGRPAAPAGAELPRRRPRRCAAARRRRRALRRWRGREGATLFMILLAGFAGAAGTPAPASTTCAVGTPVANRTRPEIEGLIGFFVNTLVLRARPGRRPGPSARCWPGARDGAAAPTPTRTCRSRSWSRSCRRARDPSRTPLFQVMLALQNAARPRRPLGAAGGLALAAACRWPSGRRRSST